MARELVPAFLGISRCHTRINSLGRISVGRIIGNIGLWIVVDSRVNHWWERIRVVVPRIYLMNIRDWYQSWIPLTVRFGLVAHRLLVNRRLVVRVLVRRAVGLHRHLVRKLILATSLRSAIPFVLLSLSIYLRSRKAISLMEIHFTLLAAS